MSKVNHIIPSTDPEERKWQAWIRFWREGDQNLNDWVQFRQSQNDELIRLILEPKVDWSAWRQELYQPAKAKGGLK